MNRSRALNRANLELVDRIPHWESVSNPDYELHVSGIDPYEKPRSARIAMFEKTPIDIIHYTAVPTTDTPIPRLEEEGESDGDEGSHTARWGAGRSWAWDWGKRFKTVEDCLAYDPMDHLDCRGAGLVEDFDYTLSVDELAAGFQKKLDATRAMVGERGLVTVGFYNTLFMWPLLTFGWELYLQMIGLYPEELKRLLAAFAERSRKAFQALAMTDAEVVTSHDDICFQAGPAANPKWLRENIYPYYEEFWGCLNAAGKKVVMICDGNVDMVVDDVFACGADGMRTEPYTDWDAMMAAHPDKIYVGDGDNRILSTEDPVAIDRMTKKMAERGKKYPGYFMSIGNHLPYNLSPECIDLYFAASEKHCQI